ncbi:N-acetylglucosamine kinase [Enterococcus mediterraneensis]|uniref:N-acetylglucosamine kinase n=1 Tax=Enterococcus mediterraneensis TaxID=2364791 RepID=UPI000F06D124|nr:BadF/BadG/BcrA/BcrD ATPase family protein [Enterococcus mediterraneensis]
MMKYVIGGDCGGTKSVYSAYDIEGRFLSEITLGAANLLVNTKNSLKTMRSGVEQLIQSMNGQCQGIVLGIAGLDTSGMHGELQELFSDLHIPLFLINDAKLSLYAKLQGEDGILLVAGTGSIALAKYKGDFYRAGGWGHLLGDEGSGYWLGKKAYQQVSYELDHEKEFSPFVKEFIEWTGQETPMATIRSFYQLDKSEAAKAARFVAEREDEISINILNQAGLSLAELVKTLIQKAEITEVLPVAFSGSVLENNQRIAEQVEKTLGSSFKQVNTKNNKITQGAWYYWRERQ